MADINKLITDNISVWTNAVQFGSSSGRGKSKNLTLHGVKKLRDLILELAVHGKLVPQLPSEEPASMLLERLANDKSKLVKEKLIKKTKNLPELTNENLPFKVPESWIWCRLQDISSYIQRGKGPKYEDLGKVKVISQKCIQWSGFDIEPARFVNDESLEKYQDERYLQSNDLLWNSTGTGTVGRINVLEEVQEKTLVADSHVTVIRSLLPNPKFISIYISAPGIQARIEPEHENALVSGSTKQVELNTSSVVALEIPLPPEEEQKRIVAKVTELMALCDQLEQQTEASIDAHKLLVEELLSTLTNSENAQEFEQNWARIAAHFDVLFTTEDSIEQLKKTILQLAVMGKLIEHKQDHGSVAEELSNRTLDKEAKVRRGVPKSVDNSSIVYWNLPKSWQALSVAELIWNQIIIDLKDGNHGTNHPVKGDWSDEGMPFITAAQVSNDYVVDYEGAHKLSGEPLDKLNVGFALPGDVVYTHKGSVGRTAILDRECVLSPQTTYYRLDDNILNNRYLMYFLKSNYFTDQVDKVKKQTTRDFVAITKQYLFFIAVPPLAEQLAIAGKIDELMGLCEQIKAGLIKAKLTQTQLAEAIVDKALS